jgi:hypothetical protein
MVFHANKINDVVADGFLAFEFQPQESMGAQVVPEFAFGLGLVAAQGFCFVEHGPSLSPALLRFKCSLVSPQAEEGVKKS